MHIIETENLTRRFKDQVAVDQLNLGIQPGQIFGLIGSNGAGKTTTVRMLTTLLNPTAGTARINGCDILKQPDKVRRSIGYIPQEAHADEALTGREHLILQGRLYGMEKSSLSRRIEEVLDLVGLRSVADQRALGYSGGMRKLLDVASGLLHQPKVLFVDEPTSGIDITHRQTLVDHLREMPAAGMTVFLTSHFLEEVDQLAERVVLLHHGKAIVDGSPAQLKASIGSSIFDIRLQPEAAGCSLQIAGRLRERIELTRVIANGNRLKIFSKGGVGLLSEIQNDLEQLHVSIAALTMAQPTLDDVFFYHTGQEIT